MDAKRAIVAIGREYGSGGHDIGKLVAKKLDIRFYDKEILTMAAKASGICEELFANHDEKAVPSYLFPLVPGMGEVSPSAGDLPLNHRIFMAQFEIITKIALEGPCVIVGRCADYVLKGLPTLVSVFLYGEVEARIRRIMQEENLPYDKAKDYVRKLDKQRQTYYNFFADGNWGHRSNYNLMLNTTGITPDAAAETIITFLHGREAYKGE